METSKDFINRVLEEEIKNKLALCTLEQQNFFHRIYGDFPAVEDYEQALDVIYRTIKKNKEKEE